VSQQIVVDREGKSPAYSLLSRALEEGRFAIVTDVGAGCGGRKDAIDEQRLSGRQSRVVLTPQWQVSNSQKASFFGMTVTNKPGLAGESTI
jgi:hypothetical protein